MCWCENLICAFIDLHSLSLLCLNLVAFPWVHRSPVFALLQWQALYFKWILPELDEFPSFYSRSSHSLLLTRELPYPVLQCFVIEICMVPVLWWFNWWFSEFTTLGKQNPFSQNCTLNVGFWFFPGKGVCPLILCHSAEPWQLPRSYASTWEGTQTLQCAVLLS